MEKNMKLNLKFHYEKDDFVVKAPPYFEKEAEEAREFGYNQENIFSEFKGMIRFLELQDDNKQSCSMSHNLIRNILASFKDTEDFGFNLFELLIHILKHFYKGPETSHKDLLEYFKAHSCIFTIVEEYPKGNIIWAHFDFFIGNLVNLGLPILLLENIENTSS